MAYEDQKVTYRHRADQLDAVAKPLRNLVWVGALALAAWVQFLGPGLAYAVRELSGSNEISAQMDVGFGVTNDRLDFIEQNIKPPVVVNWNFNRQLGECTHGECRVLHNLSRTEYGENCGVPRGQRSDFRTPVRDNLRRTRSDPHKPKLYCPAPRAGCSAGWRSPVPDHQPIPRLLMDT